MDPPAKERNSGRYAPSNPTGRPEWIWEIHNARDVTGKGSWFKRAVKAIVGIDDQKALLQPEGVAVDASGRIFVADPRAVIVRMFDPKRKQYKELRAHDSDPMVAPVDVAIDGAARSTCYDPHASSAPMLINFDLSVVGPSSSGQLQYVRTGTRQGQCYLTCHGVDHNPKAYGSGTP
jgi:streptogramin lyase